MCRIQFSRVFRLFFCLAFWHPVTAFSQDEKPVTRAVVIGISKYRNLSAGLQLNFADRDARSMFDFISQGGFGPVKQENIRLLTNETANFEQVRNAVLQSLYHKDAKPGDHVIIYFAGHGDMQSEFNAPFLLTHDAPENKDYHLYGAFEIDELQKHVGRAAARGQRITLIVDACRSGKIFSENGSKLTLQSLIREWENVVKIISCGPDENSLEGNQWGGGHGVFTYYLLRALEGLADADADRTIRVFELNEFLAKKVREETNFKQIPKCVGSDKKIVVQVGGTVSGTSGAGKGETRSRALGNFLSSESIQMPEIAGSKRHFQNLYTGRDSLIKEAQNAILNHFFTPEFKQLSDSVSIDSCPPVRIPFRPGFSLEGLAGQDSCIYFMPDGKWRLYHLSEGLKVDSGSSWEYKVKNTALNWPWLVYREYKEDKFTLLNLKTGKRKSIDPENGNFRIKKIWISPTGKYLVAISQQNGILVYDCEKNKEKYELKKAFLQTPDHIHFHPQETSFTLFSFYKSGQVLWFPMIKPWSGGKMVYTFKDDINGDTRLLTASDKRRNGVIFQAGKGPLFTLRDYADSVSFMEHSGRPEIRIEKQALRILTASGRHADISLQEKSTLITVRGNETVDIQTESAFQRNRIFERPENSAEELIALLPDHHPEKRRLEIRLAEELEIFSGRPMAEYTTSGKLARPDSLSFSIAMLKKAVKLYGDSLLSETALKKSLLFDGLLYASKTSIAARDSALACFSELNKRYPKAAFPLNAIGEVLQKSFKTAEAKTFLEKAQKFTPQWILPSQNIQKGELMEGNIEKARASFEQLLARKDFTPAVARNLAEIYFRYGDLNRASAILRKAEIRFPDDDEILFLKARIFSRKKNYEKAWRNIFMLLERHPAGVKPVIILANMPGKIQHRLNALKKAAYLNPSNQELAACILLFLNQHKLISKEKKLAENAMLMLGNYDEGIFWKGMFRPDGSIIEGIPDISATGLSFESWFGIADKLYESGFFRQSLSVLEKMEQNWKNSLPLLLLKAKNLAETAVPSACLSMLDDIDQNRKTLKNSLNKDSLEQNLLKRLEDRLNFGSRPENEKKTFFQPAMLISCVDSVIRIRNTMGLRTDDAYLAGFMNLRNRELRKHLASRRNPQGYGLYTPTSSTCGEEMLLRAACLYRAGNYTAADKVYRELKEYDSGDARIPELKYKYNKDSKTYKSEFRNLAYSGNADIQLHEFGPFRVLSNAESGEHLLNLPSGCEKLFLTGKNGIALLSLRDASGKQLLFNPETGDSLFNFGLQTISLVWNQELLDGKAMLSAIARYGDGWGIIRSDGKWSVENQHQTFTILNGSGKNLFAFTDSTGKTGIYDGAGKMLLKPEPGIINWWNENAIELIRNGVLHCFNLKKQQLTKGSCVSVEASKPGFSASKPTDAYLAGKEYPFGLRAARYYESYGYADKTERFVIKPEFESAGDFTEVNGVILANVRLKNKEGFIDRQGKFIIMPDFEQTSHTFESYPVDGRTMHLLMARKGNLEGVIDAEGKEIVPFQYKEIQYLTAFGNKTLLVASTEEGSSIYDFAGNQLAPGFFDNIRHIGGKGIFEIKDEDETLLFDLVKNEFFKLPEQGR